MRAVVVPANDRLRLVKLLRYTTAIHVGSTGYRHKTGNFGVGKNSRVYSGV
jgi:hypothetical protein